MRSFPFSTEQIHTIDWIKPVVTNQLTAINSDAVFLIKIYLDYLKIITFILIWQKILQQSQQQ